MHNHVLVLIQRHSPPMQRTLRIERVFPLPLDPVFRFVSAFNVQVLFSIQCSGFSQHPVLRVYSLFRFDSVFRGYSLFRDYSSSRDNSRPPDPHRPPHPVHAACGMCVPRTLCPAYRTLLIERVLPLPRFVCNLRSVYKSAYAYITVSCR